VREIARSFLISFCTSARKKRATAEEEIAMSALWLPVLPVAAPVWYAVAEQ